MLGSFLLFKCWFAMAIAGGFSLTSSRQGNLYSFRRNSPSSLLSVWHPVTCWQQSLCEWQVICLLTASHSLWHLPAVSDPWINIKTLTTWHRFKGLNNNVLQTHCTLTGSRNPHFCTKICHPGGWERLAGGVAAAADYLHGWAATLCYSWLISVQWSFEHLCLCCNIGIWAIRDSLV